MDELPICTKIDGYLLICVCSGSQLLFLVTGNGQFWRNVYTDRDFQSLKTQSTMTVEQYKYKLLSALKLHPTDPQFTVERLDSSLQILWSKEVKKGIQVKFGTLSLPVSESPMQNIQEVVEALANQVRQLNEQNSRVMEEHEKLRKIADAAVQKYDQLVLDTEAREGTLLKHFLEVLNEKKRKIAELQGSQTSPTLHEACLTKDTSNPEPLAKSLASEDSLDDGEELLPKIPRTSKSVLSRAFPTRRGGKSKTVKSVPKPPGTSSCSANNASLDELLDSL
ncbi:hypothetical protein CSKR_114084 [Clonorchis sinensis]|uniref:XRCC4 coiled-coil domain-containing protein n=1 Tax=Clonorchis sinensis TaxID=79923 RepID=A0A8T1M994_CLOSI|nr:hypothetical protein CSKR_114084 [Clonorchis sinensis]